MGLGSVNAPFWPHPVSADEAIATTRVPSSNRLVARSDPATLIFRFESIPAILLTMSRTTVDNRLSDADYQRLTNEVLGAIEAAADRWLQDDVIDIDTHRTGGLLELSFPNGSKLIVNTQPPLQEIWLAARAGGYHYRFAAGRWVDTRDGGDFWENLSAQASSQGGRTLNFEAP